MNRQCIIRSPFRNDFKVAIVGCGNVGAAAAYAMLMEGSPTELVLINRDVGKAKGLLLDFEHSMSFFEHTKLTASDDYAACKDAQLVFVTAGARQAEGETRLDLIEKNRKIFKDIIPKIAAAAPQSILVIVSNPVDVLTYEALKLSGFPSHRVFGTGTLLDTARFQFHISERLCLSPKSIDAFVLGEHGDSSFPVWSSANVSGKSLFDFEGFDQALAEQCYKDTKEAAYRIIHDLGYTAYSIGTVMKEIMVHVFQHSQVVLPLSVKLEGYHGHRDVCLSVPCVLGSQGIEEQIVVPLNEREQKDLQKSVDVLKSYLS